MTLSDFYIQEYCDSAVEIAKKVSDVRLDYSESSLDGLDKVIGEIRRIKLQNLISEDAIWSASVNLGTYYGEVLLRNGLSKRDFTWQIYEDMPVLMDRKANAISPIYKIYKKLSSPKDTEGALKENYKMFLFMLDNAEKEYRAMQNK